MARNIEIKARVEDLEGLRKKVETLCSEPAEEIIQEDTFFLCPEGRFKLRDISDGKGQLIFYKRVNKAGPKLSNYMIYETDDTETLMGIIKATLGVRGMVRKRRWLYWFGSTRIHLDLVDGLGTFMELEVVLGPEDSWEDGSTTAAEIMDILSINKANLIEDAYIDLLENHKNM